MYKIEIDPLRHTIKFRMSGSFPVAQMKQLFSECKRAFEELHGDHIVLADMRGLAVLSPESAEIFGQIIRCGRENGTKWCVHLSDSSIAALQASRLSREVSKHDTITINVVSLEEADRVIAEKQSQLKMGPTPPAA